MKKSMKRLAALFMALSMCMAMVPAVAAWSVPGEVGITMTATANEQANGNYNVTYRASVTVSEEFANAAAHASTAGYKDELKNLRFTCTLTDKLVAQMPNGTVDGFSFSGEGIYEKISATKSGDSIIIVYKLKESAVESWNGEIEVAKSAVKTTLTMSSTKSVTKSQMESALAASDPIAISANVVITRNGVGNIPVMEVERITAASGSANVTVTPYSAPDPGPGPSGPSGGSGSVDDDGALGGNDGHEIEIDNSDKKGTATTEDPKAIPTDKVIVDVENIQRGYRVIRVIVKDEDGNEIKTSRVDSDSFSFTMPNSPVTVTPVYGLSATPPHESGVSEMLITDEHIIFMDGYPDNTFKPNANVRRCEVAQIFYALLRNKNITLTKDFADLAEGAWYETAVRTMATLGVVNGVGDNKFDPERPITRLEFAIMASKFAKSTDHYYDFDDVPETHWGNSFVNTAAAYGWVAGVGGNNYEPNRPISRAEVATIINNMLGRIGDYDKIDDGYGRDFKDVPDNHWGRYEIAEASTDHGHSVNSEYTDETWHD